MHIQNNLLRRRFLVAGQVQGVGFRPFVYRIALRFGLTGSVGNTSEGVCIEVQGAAASLALFAHALQHELPPLARLVRCTASDIDPVPNESAFSIVASKGQAGHSVLVSPDMGLCDACLADMRQPSNRRYRYPFTNCTNCGPRYTITRSIPYDRAVTSMACFPLCPECAAEYTDPLNRRFHAQPNACALCGPRLWLVQGQNSAGSQCPPQPTATSRAAQAQDALAQAAALLHAGQIVAIKGLGGFLLACDAHNSAAIQRLRHNKNRPHKPFAVMVVSLEAVQQLACPTPEECALLASPEKPIVLCHKRPCGAALPVDIAPDVPTVGLMLPYTPLHVALFDHYCEQGGGKQPAALVMTSGNAGGEPLCLGNREAVQRLGALADAFLLHDRDILVRADDSVITVQPSVAAGQAAQPVPAAMQPLFLRRARGFVPRPVFLPQGENACVLACGAELKATICLSRGNEAFVSQHIGDLQSLEVFGFYQEVIAHLEKLLAVKPQLLVCDAHPDFMSTRYAQERAVQEAVPCLTLQHHAAHAASVLAENNCYSPALVLTLDGTGMGTDGTIWGGELLFMHLEALTWRREGRLRPFALAGGEAAIREPWRIAEALLAAGAEAGARAQAMQNEAAPLPWAKDYAAALPFVRAMLQKNINCPQSSSCGRLFDAVAALCGLCNAISYEGQAAIRLEAAVAPDVEWNSVQPYPFPMRPATATEPQHKTAPPAGSALHKSNAQGHKEALLELDSVALFAALARDVQRGRSIAAIAAAFHLTIAEGFATMAAERAAALGIRQVGLSGGVLCNAVLARLLPAALQKRGLIPLVHHELPAGDGGLALGQAVWGRQWLALHNKEQI